MPVYVRHITRVPVCVVQIRIRFVVQIRGTIQKWKHFPGHLSWLLTFTYRSLYIEQKTKKKKNENTAKQTQINTNKTAESGGQTVRRFTTSSTSWNITYPKYEIPVPDTKSPENSLDR